MRSVCRVCGGEVVWASVPFKVRGEAKAEAWWGWAHHDRSRSYKHDPDVSSEAKPLNDQIAAVFSAFACASCGELLESVSLPGSKALAWFHVSEPVSLTSDGGEHDPAPRCYECGSDAVVDEGAGPICAACVKEMEEVDAAGEELGGLSDA